MVRWRCERQGMCSEQLAFSPGTANNSDAAENETSLGLAQTYETMPTIGLVSYGLGVSLAVSLDESIDEILVWSSVGSSLNRFVLVVIINVRLVIVAQVQFVKRCLYRYLV